MAPKRIGLMLLCLMVMVLPARATLISNSTTNMDYSGPLNGETGLPDETNREEGWTSGGLYELREGASAYDPSTGLYVNYVGELSYTSSIPAGLVTEKPVSFEIPGGLTAELHLDGEKLEGVDLGNITEPGKYVLQVTGNGLYDSTQFDFTILPVLTNSMTEYSLPTGFTLDYVTLNGENLILEYSNYIEFLEDGDYALCCSCETIGQSYSLAFRLDREAPVLELTGLVDGEANGPVSFDGLEENAYVLATLDGETSVYRKADTLEDAGAYSLSVYDQAGNHTDYQFIIHVYLNLNAWVAIAMVAAAILGLIIYSRWVRKHARVG